MKSLINLGGSAGVAAVAFFLTAPVAISQQAPPQPASEAITGDQQKGPAESDLNVEPVTQGPIHEAYAQPSPKNPEPGPIVKKKPPDPVPEEPPDRKPAGDNVQWIPGYWDWDKDRNDFLWVSGFWRIPPPGRKWVAGYWHEVQGGWQHVPGYWAPADQEQPNFVPQPPASLDTGPSVPAPDDNSFYIPGSWLHQDAGYVWRPGYWYPAYAGFVWTPAYYQWTPAGCIFVNGFWDFPCWNRGLLFSPVFFHNRNLFFRHHFFFRPHVALRFDLARFRNFTNRNVAVQNVVVNNVIINNINNFNRIPRVATPLNQFHSAHFQLAHVSPAQAQSFAIAGQRMTARGVERASFEKTTAAKAPIRAGTVAPMASRNGTSASSARVNHEFHAATGSRAGWTGEPRLPGATSGNGASSASREFHPGASTVSNLHAREPASVRSLPSPAYHHSSGAMPSSRSFSPSSSGMHSYGSMHSYSGGMHSYSGGSRSFSGGGSRGFSGGGSHGSMGGHR